MNFAASNSFINHCHDSLKKLNHENTADLNLFIDQLNSLDHQVKIESKVGQDILKLLLGLLPANNDHMLSKFCHVLQLFVTKFKVTLDQNLLNLLIKYMITSAQKCSTWVLLDVLQSLSILLYNNADKLKEFHTPLLSTSGLLLTKVSTENEDIQLAVLKCIQNITFRNQNEVNIEQEYLLNIFNVCIACLKSSITGTECHIHCKILLTSLKCLQHVLTFKVLPVDNLGELLGLLKVLLFCGFPGHGTLTLNYLYPTLTNLSLPQESKSKHDCNQNKVHFLRQKVNKVRPKGSNTKKKYKERETKSHNYGDESRNDNFAHGSSFSSSSVDSDQETFDHGHWWNTSSSDSDFSDIEERSSTKLKSLQTSTRQHAYTTLQAVFKVIEKKVMFGYWSSFLPDSPSISGTSSLNLLTTILKDPSPQVRIAAISVLTQMMRNAKQFLSLVDDRTPSHTSFITASSAVTLMVKDIHRSLLLALISENLSSVLVQILKCYATLAEVVPYNRLQSDILFKVLKSLKSLVSHKDPQVQVAALTVYGALLNSDQVPENVVEFIISSELHNDAGTVSFKNDNEELPWIIKICNERFDSRFPVALIIQVEALQILRILSGKYFSVIRLHICLIRNIILQSLDDHQPPMQLHGAKLLEVVGRGILNDVNVHFASECSFESGSNLDVVFQFWNNILGSSFTLCLMNQEQSSLQSVCCDCLSTVPSRIFTELPRKVQAFCITVVLGLAVDTNHNIRGAAVRCLGVYSLFPCLREDLSFLSDVANILTKAIKDENDIVRTKTSWALGNLSDSLLLSRNEFLNFTAEVTVSFFCDIGMASILASEDQDRVKAHAVRTIGNLLNYLPQNLLAEKEIQEFVRKAETSLLNALSTKFMKVCWNACYALSSALKNQALVDTDILHLDKILQKLLSMLSSTNSKVQINAALALSVLSSRISYDELFFSICTQFIDTLRTAKSSMDFKELKYFENLSDTLCCSLCHLLYIADIGDFEIIYNSNFEAKESLLTSFWKFGERNAADKINTVSSAYERIKSLIDSSNSTTARQYLEFWMDILNEAQMAYRQQ